MCFDKFDVVGPQDASGWPYEDGLVSFGDVAQRIVDRCLADNLKRRGSVLAEIIGDNSVPVDLRSAAARYVLRQYQRGDQAGQYQGESP